MATKIRLAPGGRKGARHYSIVVIPSHRRLTGKFIEKIGHYHPLQNENSADRIVIDAARLQYWLSVGAIPVDSIINFMKKLGITGHEKFGQKKADPRYIGLSKKTVAAQIKAAQDEAAANKKKAAAEAANKASDQQPAEPDVATENSSDNA